MLIIRFKRFRKLQLYNIYKEENEMEVSTSAGIILKLMECVKEMHSKELLKITTKLKDEAEVDIYTYKIDYRGNVNSVDYWNDLSLLKSSGLIQFTGNNPKLNITEKGLKIIKQFELELPQHIVQALPEICGRK